jgi:hypothetical protein
MRSRLLGSLLAASILAITLLVQTDASIHTSAVVDEPAHLTAGYLSLTRGDLHVNKEHPPLLKALAAMPLLFIDPALPAMEPGDPLPGTEDFEFSYSRKFLYQANQPDRLLQAARLPMMMLTLALGALVFVWTRELTGTAPALAALILYCTEPGILGHGRLVTTDLGAAAFIVGTLWILRMVSRKGGVVAAVACGLLLGAAILSKFSALLVLPVGAALVVMDRFFAAPGEALPKPMRLLNMLGITLFTGWVCLLVGYGFDGFPLPRLYLEGLELAQLKNATVEGPTYLMGQISDTGFWSYYVIGLLVKTPLPLLFLGLGGVFAAALSPRLRREAVWFIFPFLAWLAAMSLLTRAQIGVRYVLPVIPFLCIAAGVNIHLLSAFLKTAAKNGRARLAMAGTWIFVVLLGWQVFSLARVHPYHLAYFNEVAGGPENGWKWLVDSNLDWGQDLKGLKEWQEAAGNPPVNLYYFGTADPDYYGIRKNAYSRPQPGYFAVSATHLAGVYLPDPDYLSDFRDQEPVASIGHSIRIYQSDRVPAKLIRQTAR